jgi:HlyB family type I secretion system ABC transporter
MVVSQHNLERKLEQIVGGNISRSEISSYSQKIQTIYISEGDFFWNSNFAEAGIYLVIGGRVQILTADDELVSVLAEEQTFGESTLFPEFFDRAYKMRAFTNLELVYLDGKFLQHLLDKYPEVRANLYRRAIDFDLLLLYHQTTVSESIDREKLRSIVPQLKQHYLFVGRLPDGVWKKQQFWLLRQGEILHSTGKKLTPGNIYTLAQLPRSGVWQVVQPTELYSLDESVSLRQPTKTLSQKAPQIGRAFFPKPTVKLKQWLQGTTGKYPMWLQEGSMDCGVACLMMVALYWGKRLSITHLRNIANTDRGGTSLRGLMVASDSIGLQSRPVQIDLKTLTKQQLPAIAHWKRRKGTRDSNHYVVVYHISPLRVTIVDPAIGRLSLTHKEFLEGWAGYTLLLQPTATFEKVTEARSELWRFVELVKPHGPIILQILIASLLLQTFGLFIPILTQLLLDEVVVRRSVSTFAAIGVGLIVFSIFQAITISLRRYLLFHTANRIDLSLIVGFISHTFRLPISYFETRYVGDVTSRISENRKIRSFLSSEALTTILDLMTVFFYLGAMFWYSWRMALIAVGVIPLYILIAAIATPFLQRISREIFQAGKTESSYLIESLTGIATVKALSIEKNVRWSWEGLFNKSLKLHLSGQLIQERIKFATRVLEVTLSRGILLLGVWQVIHGQLTIGQLIAFNMLFGNVISPLERLISLWNSFQEVKIAVERTNDVIDSPPEEDCDGLARTSIPPLKGRIRWENVTFRYNPESKTNTIDNVSFTVEPGQTIAVVGRSGSGKTTLAKLLLGFYQPTAGKIWLDNYDLATVSLNSLRQQIGVVDQNTFLFGGTVRDNLVLSMPGASNEEVKAAAAMAGADSFIEELPLKYDAQIGEGGRLLSGGQRQRLAIARALLRRPRLLIFDEATSSLDAESERIIQTNLSTILRQQTTIIIAHRLSTVRNADLILVLDKGALVESGSHRELMERKGHYYYLNQQQL